MTDTDIELNTAAAQRMAASISPIYSRARNFLAIIDALGGQVQMLCDTSGQLINQAMPQTADWALALWESQYSLTAGGMTDDARRAQLLSRVRAVGAANPYMICRRASAASGCEVRAVENTGRNRFTLYAKRCTVDEKALRAAVDAIKPAQLIYSVKCEQDAPVSVRASCGLRLARTYRLRQSGDKGEAYGAY